MQSLCLPGHVGRALHRRPWAPPLWGGLGVLLPFCDIWGDSCITTTDRGKEIDTMWSSQSHGYIPCAPKHAIHTQGP